MLSPLSVTTARDVYSVQLLCSFLIFRFFPTVQFYHIDLSCRQNPLGSYVGRNKSCVHCRSSDTMPHANANTLLLLIVGDDVRIMQDPIIVLLCTPEYETIAIYMIGILLYKRSFSVAQTPQRSLMY